MERKKGRKDVRETKERIERRRRRKKMQEKMKKMCKKKKKRWNNNEETREADLHFLKLFLGSRIFQGHRRDWSGSL